MDWKVHSAAFISKFVQFTCVLLVIIIIICGYVVAFVDFLPLGQVAIRYQCSITLHYNLVVFSSHIFSIVSIFFSQGFLYVFYFIFYACQFIFQRCTSYCNNSWLHVPSYCHYYVREKRSSKVSLEYKYTKTDLPYWKCLPISVCGHNESQHKVLDIVTV